ATANALATAGRYRVARTDHHGVAAAHLHLFAAAFRHRVAPAARPAGRHGVAGADLVAPAHDRRPVLALHLLLVDADFQFRLDERMHARRLAIALPLRPEVVRLFRFIVGHTAPPTESGWPARRASGSRN